VNERTAGFERATNASWQLLFDFEVGLIELFQFACDVMMYLGMVCRCQMMADAADEAGTKATNSETTQ
jgi:hypothetical protein